MATGQGRTLSMTAVLMTTALWMSPPATAQAPPDLDSLAWLAGCWSSQEEGERSEECWLAPAGGLMVGVHRDVGADGRAVFEFLRIEQTPHAVVYLASPGGREPTSFQMISCDERRVVFANPEHDFPQRIIYFIDPENRLNARVEGETNGQRQALQWTWSRSDWHQRTPGHGSEGRP